MNFIETRRSGSGVRDKEIFSRRALNRKHGACRGADAVANHEDLVRGGHKRAKATTLAACDRV